MDRDGWQYRAEYLQLLANEMEIGCLDAKSVNRQAT